MRRRGSFDERASFLGIAVNSDRDYGETQGSELFVQRLPDRQIFTATSPTGPCDEEHLLAAVLGEGVRGAREVRQREAGRVERGQRVGPRRGALAEEPGTLDEIEGEWTAQQPGELTEVEQLADIEAARARHEEALVVSAQALGLSYPAERGRDVISLQQHSITVDGGDQIMRTGGLEQRERVHAVDGSRAQRSTARKRTMVPGASSAGCGRARSQSTALVWPRMRQPPGMSFG